MFSVLKLSENRKKIVLAAIIPIISILSICNSGFTNGPVLCIFRIATGHPCPACGAIRSVGALSKGEFISAWQFNPLATSISILYVSYIFFPQTIKKIGEFLDQNLNAKNKFNQNRILFILGGFVFIWILNLQRW